MTYTLSPSTLNLYLECPRCFYLSAKEKIWRPRGPFPSIASGMDQRVKEEFDSYRVTGSSPPQLREIGLELFKDVKLLEVWRDNKRGLRWQDEKGNTLMGAIDDVLVQDDGTFTVIDYKTKGFDIKEEPLTKRSSYKFQLETYAVLFQKNGYRVTDHAYLFFSIPQSKLGSYVQFREVLLGFKLDLQRPEKVFREALSLLDQPQLPQRGGSCDYCRREERIVLLRQNE